MASKRYIIIPGKIELVFAHKFPYTYSSLFKLSFLIIIWLFKKEVNILLITFPPLALYCTGKGLACQTVNIPQESAMLN